MTVLFIYSSIFYCLFLLLLSTSGVTAFTHPFNVLPTSTMTSALITTTGVDASSSSLFLLLDNGPNTNIFIATVVAASAEGGSVGETAVINRQVGGLINWDNPAESIGGAITLLYIVFSILAGIKYVVKDGWRPKL
jgi:small ligand-binding sensory domain FIST